MLYAGWTYEDVAKLDGPQLIAAIETYSRMREEELNTTAALLGAKKGSRGR